MRIFTLFELLSFMNKKATIQQQNETEMNWSDEEETEKDDE